MAKLPMRVLVGSKLPTGRASGMMMDRPAKVRFSMGRLATSSSVTTPLRSDRVVSMRAAEATTSMASSRSPTASSTFRVARVPTSICTSRMTVFLNPDSSAVTV